MNKNWSKHPALDIVVPTRDPDFRGMNEDVWFEEGIYAYKGSYNNEYVNCKLMYCTFAKVLMYMVPLFPVQWIEINNWKIEEAYLRYIVEKELLQENIFEDGQESSET